MTYGVVKNLARGFLTGDNVLPKEPEIVQALTQMALHTVANRADSLQLLTLETDENTLRLGPGDYFVRTPITPVEDTDIVDVETELCFAVARLLASYISKERGGIHVNEAKRIILDFNSVVDEVEQTAEMALENIEAGTNG